MIDAGIVPEVPEADRVYVKNADIMAFAKKFCRECVGTGYVFRQELPRNKKGEVQPLKKLPKWIYYKNEATGRERRKRAANRFPPSSRLERREELCGCCLPRFSKVQKTAFDEKTKDLYYLRPFVAITEAKYEERKAEQEKEGRVKNNSVETKKTEGVQDI